MSFHIFAKNTLVDPSAMNDNFKHVGEGDMLPRGGLTLTATDAVYDLGSSDYKWAEIHCQSATTYGELQNTWNLISRIELTTTALVIEVSNLNGDTDEIYNIIFRGVVITTTANSRIHLHLNGDSVGNYGFQYLLGNAATITALRDVAEAGMLINFAIVTTTNTRMFSDCYLYAKTGNERLCISEAVSDEDGRFARYNWVVGSIWNNTSDTVTSIKISGVVASTTFGTSSVLEIWSKR